MTELQKLQMELGSINWIIGQASNDGEREELEELYGTRIQQILNEIEIIKQSNA